MARSRWFAVLVHALRERPEVGRFRPWRSIAWAAALAARPPRRPRHPRACQALLHGGVTLSLIVVMLGLSATPGSAYVYTEHVDGISDQSMARWDMGFSGSYFAGYFKHKWIEEGHIRYARYVVQWNVMSESTKGPNPHGNYHEQFEAWYQDATSLGLTIDVAMFTYTGSTPETSTKYSEALSALLNAFTGIRSVEAWNEPNNSPYITPGGAAHFANKAYSLCTKHSCTAVVGDFLDSSNSVSYETTYEKSLSPSNPPNWGIHPYRAVKEQNEAPVYELQKHLPGEGAADELWYTEIGAYRCEDYSKLELRSEEQAEQNAFFLTHLLMVNEKALHVFYYEFLPGNREQPPCTSTQADTALYIPSTDPNAPDRPRGDAAYVYNNTYQPWSYTGPASNVGATRATLTGSSYFPCCHETQTYFEYGTSTSYGATTSRTTFPLEYGARKVEVEASGLQPSTMYHYRLVTVNAIGLTPENYSYGEDKTFTTPASALLETPNPGTASASDYLTGVSCTAAASCVTVGQQNEGTAKDGSFAAHWNGLSWTSEPLSGPEGRSNSVYNVSCRSSTECMAVGEYEAPGTTYAQSFAALWNGTAWTTMTGMPLPAEAKGSRLRSVSCVSATFCIAVGEYFKSGKFLGYAVEWNGSSWSLLNVSSPEAKYSPLTSVSCTATTFCIAAGDYGNYQMLEEWNGSEWKIKIPFGEGELRGVSCTSATACTAVGPVTIARWNGTEWVKQTPAYKMIFEAVACSSATACIAVGTSSEQSPNFLAAAETWNGAEWHTDPTSSPEGTYTSALNSVSCANGTCIASGFYRKENAGPARTLGYEY